MVVKAEESIEDIKKKSSWLLLVGSLFVALGIIEFPKGDLFSACIAIVSGLALILTGSYVWYTRKKPEEK